MTLGDGVELEEVLFSWLLAGVEQLAEIVRQDRGRSVQRLSVQYSAPTEPWGELPALSAIVSSSDRPFAIRPSGQVGLRRALIQGLERAVERDPDQVDAKIGAQLERVAERLAERALPSVPHRQGLQIRVVRRDAPVAASNPEVVALAAASEDLVVSAHADGRLLAWPTSGAAPREIIGPSTRVVWQVVRGQDGRVLCRCPGLVDESGSLAVIDAGAATVRRVDSGHEPDGVADLAASGGHPLSAGARDGRVRIWDLRAGTSRPLPDKQGAGVVQLFVLRDGRVMSTGKNGGVRLWDPSGASREVFDRGGYGALKFAEGPAGQILKADRGHHEFWDLERGVREPLGRFHDSSSLTTLPDGRVLSGGMDGSIHLFDLGSGTTRELPSRHSRPITGLIALPGDRIVSAARGALSLWGLETQVVAASLALETAVARCLRIQDDLVAVGDRKGHVHFVEVASATATRAGPAPDRPLLRIR